LVGFPQISQIFADYFCVVGVMLRFPPISVDRRDQREALLGLVWVPADFADDRRFLYGWNFVKVSSNQRRSARSAGAFVGFWLVPADFADDHRFF
jgi:hypothetical protein